MRGDQLARKYCGNVATHLPQRLISKDLYFINFTYVYVKRDNAFTALWQQRFFRCMGSKTHVICQCNNMLSSLPILGMGQNKSAFNALGLNLLSFAVFHVLPGYAENVPTHVQLLMILLLHLIPLIMSTMPPMV
jgi:hypothetical protein